MNSEWGSSANLRYLPNDGNPAPPRNDWIYVLDELPQEGDKVICHGNLTTCCDLDMEEAEEHNAIFRIKISSYRELPSGQRYDIKTYFRFDLDPPDEPHHLIFVSRWKRRSE